MSASQSLASPPILRADRRWHLAVILGVLAGPVLVAATLAQAATRDGFDLAEHPLSLLALGDNGWIQTVNFVSCGAAFIAAAIAEGRTTGALSRWTERMIVLFGTALVTAGVFQTNPWNGYPTGADESVTWSGVVHNGAAAVGGLTLVAASFIVVRSARRHDRRTLATTSALAGSGYVVLSIALLAGAITWSWTSAILADTQR